MRELRDPGSTTRDEDDPRPTTPTTPVLDAARVALQPGVGTVSALMIEGDRHAAAEAPESPESPLPQPKLSPASIEYLLGTREGLRTAFPEGYYTREQFAKLSKALAEDVELIAVWDNDEDDAEGAEIFGRVDGGPWRGLSFEFEDYLTDENDQPVPTNILWPTVEKEQPDLDELVTTDSYNFTLEACQHFNAYRDEEDGMYRCEACDEVLGR
jgi:hypothetical protein